MEPVIEDLGEETPPPQKSREPGSKEQPSFQITTQKEVPDFEIFKLGKKILAVCATIFVLAAATKVIFKDNKGVDDVWDFSKTILNSITSLVLGLYFGNRSSKR